MRLLYSGLGPVTFTALGVEVEPGDVFDVPDDLADGFLARPDVQAVPVEKPKRGAKAPSSATPVSAGDVPDSALSLEEAGRAVPDDH